MLIFRLCALYIIPFLSESLIRIFITLWRSCNAGSFYNTKNNFVISFLFSCPVMSFYFARFYNLSQFIFLFFFIFYHFMLRLSLPNTLLSSHLISESDFLTLYTLLSQQNNFKMDIVYYIYVCIHGLFCYFMYDKRFTMKQFLECLAYVKLFQVHVYTCIV